MFDEQQLVGSLTGDIIFYADNTAVFRDIDSSQEYEWSIRENHLLLFNVESNFLIPYQIELAAPNQMVFTQGDAVKMSLIR